MAFADNTRAGTFSEKDISFHDILQCTISREDVAFIEDNNGPNNRTVYFGIH